MAGGEVMAHKNGAKPKGRQRKYTAPERLGYMMLALQTSSEQVEAEYKVPARTIRQWFDAAGGIAECRRWLEAEVLTSYLQSRRAVFQAVMDRAPDLGEEQLMETYRKMVTPAESHGVNINLTQQQAQGVDGRNLSAAESAYVAALRGQPSTESGEDVSLPALPLPSNGTGGPLPSEDSE